ncbi:MAG: GNAT family N-acetyltransferase [Muribaculaceae bacterium]|nr:GNAT family N-acetyltransferase [Muribaculaceae bacterium]
MKFENIPVVHTEDLATLINWRMEALQSVDDGLTAAERERLEEEIKKYYLRSIPTGNHYAVLASPGGEAIGCGALNFYSAMPTRENPSGACADLVNLYVRPAFRRQGVATAIIDHLKEIARRVGVARIYIRTRDAARSLMSHEGFIAVDGVMVTR